MILVTTGGGVLWKFDRLVKCMDELAPELTEEVIIQKGCADYIPKNAKFYDFVTMEEFLKLLKEADIVVGHAAAGTTLLCSMNKKPFVACPRKPDLKEIFDGHQFDLAERIKKYKWVRVAAEKNELKNAIGYFKSIDIKSDEDFRSAEKDSVIENIKTTLKEWQNV